MKIQDDILPQIVDKACKGDPGAQRCIYDRFGKAMYNVCLRMVENREDAEDVLQDAFVIVFKSLDTIKDKTRFSGWLKKIVVSQCVKHIRKNIRWVELTECMYDDTGEDEDEWFQGISMAQIGAEISRLPYGCRQIFSLYVTEDYSHAEIAALFGISESTSKSQYKRARALLKKSLTKILAQNGSL
ncbi:MAG: sigma-70 family RNA polymerase sigma factor [Chitinophagaceae bacterium]|nr:sigma-70 family RNA polymerase sigma factor [Chitinophagaceae bacterium]